MNKENAKVNEVATKFQNFVVVIEERDDDGRREIVLKPYPKNVAEHKSKIITKHSASSLDAAQMVAVGLAANLQKVVENFRKDFSDSCDKGCRYDALPLIEKLLGEIRDLLKVNPLYLPKEFRFSDFAVSEVKVDNP